MLCIAVRTVLPQRWYSKPLAILRCHDRHRDSSNSSRVNIIHGTQDSAINNVAFAGGARYSDALKPFAVLIQRHQLDAGSQ